MTDTERHPRPMTGMGSALALAAALIFTSPIIAVAQDAPPPAASNETMPVKQAQPATGGAHAGTGTTPASTGANAQAGETEPAQAGSAQAPASDNDRDASARTGTAPVEVTGPAEPAPSFIENPAGAVSHMLSTERDGNLPHDLSPWGMFMAADWVVKAVMIALALASLGVWTVWVAKTVEIACAKARARRAAGVIASASTLADASHKLAGRGGPAAFMVRSAEDELRRSSTALDHAGNDGVKERLGARLARIEAQSGRRLSRGTGLLATVGSTAPFIGLFGTVWGIMNAFIGISEAQTTNLAVVAPGIAEALLATAIGLVAAIPAVIVYNVFARSIASYAQLLADAASGVEQLVSLDLDLRQVPANDPGSPARTAVPASASPAAQASLATAAPASNAAAE